MSEFHDVLTEAVADVAERGYVSPEFVAEWARRLREAAERSLTPPHILEEGLKRTFGIAYRRLIEKAQILKHHAGIPRFTFERLKPTLRRELDRRIMASANLIKLNREAAIQKTLQRFQGWATSVPPGGSDIVSRRKVKSDVRKALASLPFEERRVAIDQGHKFAADLSHVIATDGGAIAGIWQHHHVRYPRAEHVARDGDIFLIRDCWAHAQGLAKAQDEAAYTDRIERPGELVYCRCSYQWIYNLRDLPPDMLTAKGRESLARVKAVA